MSELGLIAPLGGLVAIALFYMRRLSEGAAATAWGVAWLVLYLAGTLLSLPDAPEPLVAAGHVLGSLFPVLLYAGSVSFRDGGPLPRGPLLAGIAMAAVRSAFEFSDRNALALALSIPLELPFTIGAAWVIWHAGRGRRSFPEQMLPPTLVVLAIVNAADPITRLVGIDRVPLVLAWTWICFATSLLQIAAFVERGRGRERQLLLERNLLYRVARVGTEAQGRRLALEAIALAVAEAQWFDVFGIWLASADGQSFDRVARMRRAEPAQARFDHFPADAPLLIPVFASEEPVMIAERRGSESARFRRHGLGDVAAVALRDREHTLGFVIAGLTPDRSLGEAERRVLGSITRELALVLAHVDSIEERERQATALARERRLLRALVEAVPVGIMLVDRNDRITMLSRVGAEHFGFDAPEAWNGRPAIEMVPAYAHRLCEASASQLLAGLAKHASGSFDGLELRFVKPVERVIRVSARPVSSDDGEPLGRVFVSLDVTAERELGERMQRAQRMETLGTLASGVAHDFNNQLTAILGNARTLEGFLSSEQPARAALADLESAAEHCTELTRGLLDLARPAPAAPQPVAVDKVVREVEALLRASLAPDVELRIDVEPGTFAHADPVQLRRVLTNLALNARDAMGARGEIEISVRLATPDPAAPGGARCVEFVVRDTGVGMDANTLERVFDPFFSTKPPGQGTGLGLAIVSRIVESHGASIEVESAHGRGTRFRILWPAAIEASRETEVAAQRVAGGHECVLLAEDEPAVRRLARAALERHGYRVLEACNGDEAIALFERHRDAIDGIVIDLSMPRRNGLDVIAAVRASARRIPAVLMSGQGGLERSGELPDRVITLAKPFRPDELASALRRALDSAAQAD